LGHLLNVPATHPATWSNNSITLPVTGSIGCSGTSPFLLFRKALFFVILSEVRTQNPAALQFEAFCFRRNDVSFLRVADYFRFVRPACRKD
jgi:hypothetical protein